MEDAVYPAGNEALQKISHARLMPNLKKSLLTDIFK